MQKRWGKSHRPVSPAKCCRSEPSKSMQNLRGPAVAKTRHSHSFSLTFPHPFSPVSKSSLQGFCRDSQCPIPVQGENIGPDVKTYQNKSEHMKKWQTWTNHPFQVASDFAIFPLSQIDWIVEVSSAPGVSVSSEVCIRLSRNNFRPFEHISRNALPVSEHKVDSFHSCFDQIVTQHGHLTGRPRASKKMGHIDLGT